MATYHEFCGLAGRFGGRQLGADVWIFDLQGRGEDRAQKVAVFYEVMPPGGIEFLQIKSAFALISSVDCEQIIKEFGQLNVGAIGYNPRSDSQGNPVDGFVTISSSFPLAAIDLDDATSFFLYLHLLGQAADTLEQKFDSLGGQDAF